jgi:LPXTG-motif cell wall-anchored protein
MSERFVSDLLFILVVLIGAAILGFIIGYLLRKRKNKVTRHWKMRSSR